MPPSPLEPLLNALLALRNRLDYPLRQAVRFRRGGVRFTPDPHADLFAHLPPEPRAQAQALAARLADDYHLANLAQVAAPGNTRENLFYLHMLEEALNRSGASLPAEIHAADIGPSSWFYVQALYALLRWWRLPQQGRDVTLTGYEVDAYRIYSDLHSRYDHALAHLRGLSGVTYLPQGFWRQPDQFHVITMLFPFVFSKDHLQWGLPPGMFDPRTLLSDAWASLRPGGVLIIVNQGLDERHAQRQTLSACGIEPAAGFRQDPLLFSYAYERYVWVAVRDG